MSGVIQTFRVPMPNDGLGASSVEFEVMLFADASATEMDTESPLLLSIFGGHEVDEDGNQSVTAALTLAQACALRDFLVAALKTPELP